MYHSTFCSLRTLPRLPSQLRTRSSRWLCSVPTNNHKSESKRVVFLGTPTFAANTLDTLIQRLPEQNAHVVGVVTRPPAKQGRSRKLQPSPVHELAEERQVASILTPKTARDPVFLSQLEALQPDLCVTAAYGCILPQKFLDIPTHGTLNIHPSLLPHYRGAAPVPRFLLDGGTTTGVTVAWTVLALDAGPILTQTFSEVGEDETAPDLLTRLFSDGTNAMLDALPSVWNDTAVRTPQDDSAATHAPKLSKEDARLSFCESAQRVHNRVRALTGWPGTWGEFQVGDDDSIRLKVLRTSVLRREAGMCLGVHDVTFDDERQCLRVTCDDGSVVGVHEVQPPGKRAMTARAFWNGVRASRVGRKRVPH